MTDRHSAYIVTLDRDIREDDAESIISALRMIKHVSSVEPVVADTGQHIAEMRANQMWRDRLYSLITDTP